MVVHGTQGEVGGQHEGVGLFFPLFCKSQGLNLGCQVRCQHESLYLMSHLAGPELCAKGLFNAFIFVSLFDIGSRSIAQASLEFVIFAFFDSYSYYKHI